MVGGSMTTKNAEIKVLEQDEVCVLYNLKVNEELLNMILNVGQNFCRERAQRLFDLLENFGRDFSIIYEQYLNALEKNRTALANELVKTMRDKQTALVNDILSTEGGHLLAEVAEQKGVRIDWQKIPLSVINDMETFDFLLKKGYDFNQQQDFEEKKVVLSDYHLALLARYEYQTILQYDTLMEWVAFRNQLIENYKYDVVEYNNPQTLPEDKEALKKAIDFAVTEYENIKQQIPLFCKRINHSVAHYFMHEGCVEHAIKNGFLSQENEEKISWSMLMDSVGDMLIRCDKIKKICAFFEGQSKDVTGSLDEAEVYNCALLETLAASGGSMPVYDLSVTEDEITEEE